MKASDLSTFLSWGVLPGIGIPIALTTLFWGVLQTWTPLAMLAVIVLLVIWPIGLFWAGVWLYALLDL